MAQSPIRAGSCPTFPDGFSGDSQDLSGDGGFILFSAAFYYSHAQFSTELSTHWVTEGGAVMQLWGHTLAGSSQANFSSPASFCHLWEV